MSLDEGRGISAGKSYADVIVNISHAQLDRPFQYIVPQALQDRLEEGTPVNVPFGRGRRLVRGYCVGFSSTPAVDAAQLKEIDSIEEKGSQVEEKLIRLAAWLRRTYGGTMIAALKTVLPVKRRVKKRAAGQDETAGENGDAKGQTQETFAVSREDFSLTEEQQDAVRTVMDDAARGEGKTYLLFGVTGSGKTAVYIELARRMAEAGKQTIVLIPEISLTYQTIGRFREVFGERTGVLHSGLSLGERYELYEKAKNGELDVAVGARSALFTPFSEIGLIVIDEEHESSYKSETMPRYHARETAIALAGLHNASVLLGSATPSVETYDKALSGEYGLLRLSRRVAGGNLPRVYIEDMRKELREGNRQPFSRRLTRLLTERLEKKEQSILFLNRRGYAGFISCRACGNVVKCPHCDVSLSEHGSGRLLCHYCGYTAAKPSVCPVCGSKYIMGFKAGTEQIEERLKRVFPKARILRMDRDTTAKKHSYERILKTFSEGKADILLGTQMIVKGHDFPRVTLVGVLAADLSFADASFRAEERTFSLLTQAAGRAGRGELPGEVVIQTYRPEEYSIVRAAAQDYEGFYREEIAYRRMLRYPPAAHMLAAQMLSSSEGEVRELAELLAEALRKRFPALTVVGPAPARIGKLSDKYRFAFYCKDESAKRLADAREYIESVYRANVRRDALLQFDLDPQQAF